MKFKIYSDHLRDASSKFKLSMYSNIVMALIIAVLAINNQYLARTVRTIVVPTHLAAQIEFRGERASPEYSRVMLIYMTHLLYTYTPKSVAGQYKEFLAYVPAESLEAVKNNLQKRINQISKLRVNETFMPNADNDVIFLDDNTAVIDGRTIRRSGSEELATEDLVLKYSFRITNGGFRIDEVSLLTRGELTRLLRSLDK